jgi:hypothetical protein
VRRRGLRLLLVASLLPGCGLVRESSIEPGPEQFLFTVTAGPGAGPAADALARDVSAGPGGDLVPESANLVASVMTPLGQVDIVRFQVISQGRLNDCEGEYGQTGSSGGCGIVGGLDDLLGGAVVAVTGGGSFVGSEAADAWSTSTIRVAPEVATIVAVAEDGTRYTIVPAAGYGYVVWPAARGSLTLTALDADGAALGTAEAASPLNGRFDG